MSAATGASASRIMAATCKGNNDILTLTRPDVIGGIHRAYLEAGADIIETNTFNSNSVSQADYGTEALVPELNYRAARLARAAADEYASVAGRPAFVGGCARADQPHELAVAGCERSRLPQPSFDELVATYLDSARALLLGGVDLLLIETVIDTLNAKAAIYAVLSLFDETGIDVPIMISGTITDASGRDALGPDRRGVLELHPPCAAAVRRTQLCARRPPAASLHRGAGACRGHVRVRLSERGSAERLRRV